MIIEAKPLSPFAFKVCSWIFETLLKRRFNKLPINKIDIESGHSYLLMSNHFSFVDGAFAFYLCNKAIWGEGKMRRLYIMVNKRQMQKNKWTRYLGCFSVDPRQGSIRESLDYAGRILSQPGNLLLFFPQGNLESIHVDHIHFEAGIEQLIKRVSGPCQLIWSSNIVEFFESTKPSVYFDMLDCGTAADFNIAELKAKVNGHHKLALQKHVRLGRNR